MGGGGGSSRKYCKKRGGALANYLAWRGGLTEILIFPIYFSLPPSPPPPPPPLYINNDRSLTAYLHQLYFSLFSPPAVVTCAIRWLFLNYAFVLFRENCYSKTHRFFFVFKSRKNQYGKAHYKNVISRLRI